MHLKGGLALKCVWAEVRCGCCGNKKEFELIHK